MDKLLLTPMEAAAVLGVGRSKVYELMRAGALGSVRIDSCRRIPVEDLSALVSRLRAAGSYAGTVRTSEPEALSA
ncbi:MAG: helix-turn-helix domain-containing protein [Actinobacteria bacterium]|nr:helix-turn-helix domain-containing protein [Actinomycetota bacterium]